MKKILVTGCGGPLGVNISRSLRMAPELYYLIGTDSNKYHIPLSLTYKSELIPHASKENDYIDAINRVVKKHDVDLVFPTHPFELTVLGKHRSELTVKFLMPRQEVIELGNDKYLSYKTWKNKGIAVPETCLIKKEIDINTIFKKFKDRPVWVRGRGTPGTGVGGKALACNSEGDAAFWIKYWKGWGNFIASEYLPGENMTWLSLWKDGKLVTSQGRLRLEYVLPHVSQSGITGAPAVSKTVKSKELAELGETAVLAIDEKPNGVYFVDFKKDSKGKLKITEINAGRFGTTIHFYTEAGVNFPYIYLKLAFDEKVPPVAKYDPIREGVFWLRTLDCGPVMLDEDEFQD